MKMNFAAVHESGFVLVFGRRQQRDDPQAQLAGVQKAPRHEAANPECPQFGRYRG
jgi:hypothetical protein